MRNYTEFSVLSIGALQMFKLAQAVVAAIPDGLTDLRCHEVARAVAIHLQGLAVQMKAEIGADWSVTVEDGRFGAADHSWIEVTSMGGTNVIIDPYCVGRLPQVQILDCDRKLPHRQWYFPCGMRHDIDGALVEKIAGFYAPDDNLGRIGNKAT